MAEPIDTSTCEQRLTALAALPEYAAIRGDLLHAAAELAALMRYVQNQQPTDSMITAGVDYMVDHSPGHVKRWRPINRDDLAGLFTAMLQARE